MAQRVYLDHAAGSALIDPAREAMNAVWSLPGNPSAIHGSGRRARRLLEESREALAGAVDAPPSAVIFTSGGTEANNLILLGAAAANPERDRLAIGGTEHPSVAGVVGVLAGRVDVVAVDRGGLIVPSGRDVIGPRTALVSTMLVNNETGVVQALSGLTAAARSAGALMHTDAVQAFGQMPLSFVDLDVDAMTITAHKVGGPVGIGALVLRREAGLAPPGFGGGQERRIRSGTAMVALAAGFAAAAGVAVASLEERTARLRALNAAATDGIRRSIPDAVINSSETGSPAIVNATFPGCRADDVLLILDAAGIDASTGSACTAGVHQPSDVLLAMGRSLADASASLRFSFGHSTTASDVEALMAVLPGAVARARSAYA